VAVLDDLGAYLEAQDVGTLGVSLFRGPLPLDSRLAPVHDAIMALIETPGLPSLHVHNKKEASAERPTVQILARGAPFDYEEARARAQAAYDALDGLANITLSGTQYLSVFALQPPFFLHADQAGRPVIAFNVLITKSVT
jgi:hypothetical protein